MEALLASPSSYSSPESNASSSFDSPRLPDLESPVRFGQHDIFTPSSISSVTQEVPAWLDEDLEEEWVEHEASHSTSSPNSRLFSPNVERFGTVKTFSSAASSRRPSGLRHVLSDSSLRNIDQQEVGSAAGSLVVKSLDSVAQAAAAPAHSPKQPSQLELAARAIKGKQGGIGSPAQMSASQSIGLLKLFEPPSPPENSARAGVPSRATFDFTPVQTHESRPTEETPRPLAMSNLDATPTRPMIEATAPKPKDRYLKSAAVVAAATTTAPAVVPISSPRMSVRTSTAPATPATFHTASDGGTPQSSHRIFEYQHDSYTRQRLDALVDDIDALGTYSSGNVSLFAAYADDADETSSSIDSYTGRSTKRIRLSSAAPSNRASRASRQSHISPRRRSPASASMRRSLAQSLLPELSRLSLGPTSFARNSTNQEKSNREESTATESKIRSTLGEANALLDRLRNRDSRPPTPRFNESNTPTRTSTVDLSGRPQDMSDLIKLDDSPATTVQAQSTTPLSVTFDRDQGRWRQHRRNPSASPTKFSPRESIIEEPEDQPEGELEVTTRGDLVTSSNASAQPSRVVSLSMLEAGGLGITQGTPMSVVHHVPSPLDRNYFEPMPMVDSPAAPTVESSVIAKSQTFVMQPVTSTPTTINDTMATPRPRRESSSIVPRSVLKSAKSSAEGSGNFEESTPFSRPPRSVSFSDGKRIGQIEGLVAVSCELFAHERTNSHETVSDGEGEEEREFDLAHGAVETTDEISAASGATTVLLESKPVDESPSEDGASSSDSAVICSFESAPRLRKRTLSRSTPASRTFTRTTGPNATFLTQCSFSVAQDKIVQYITDVEPFEPNWEGLRSIALVEKGADSLIRLKDFLPSLDELDISKNEVGFLTGVPATVRSLRASVNRLTDLTSFAHLQNLVTIDVSNNQLESLKQLSCLGHLRELVADGNRIASIEGTSQIDGLLKLSLKGNALKAVDFAKTRWEKLEFLDLSNNSISSIQSVDHLRNLMSLNIDHNAIEQISCAQPMPKLRVLRASFNPIKSLNVSFAPKLRTLFVDNAELGELHGTENMRKLENLSVRDQSGSSSLSLHTSHVRDIRRLYLSGNVLVKAFPNDKFFNLTYLELAMCQLDRLPTNLASRIPNVRTLDMSHNPLSSLAPLKGLLRLGKLVAVGTRVNKCRPLLEVLESMPELEEVDLRATPLTLAFYAPTTDAQDEQAPHFAFKLVSDQADVSKAASKSEQWSMLDTKFRKSLSDEWYQRRTTYRAFLISSAPSLAVLDGLPTEGERPRYESLVAEWRAKKNLSDDA